ncbi:MAG: hypothetical protein DHS20C19_27220 [Acidimicrobiales bacterium]|nr:MAG: hypothetical protein DHS20C19_27220 [Acidimicrobiales bacterium]
MTDTRQIPARKATLKDRIERDRLAQLTEPGTGSRRLASLIATAKEKAGR